MKKIILTIVLTFGIIGVILTSCLCKDVQDYWMPESLSSKIVDFESSMIPYESNDTINTDSISIEVYFEHIYLSEMNNEYFNLGNSAFASQKCPLDGNEGLKYGVQSFKITSNKDYDSIPAGENLHHLLYNLKQEKMSNSYTQTFEVIDTGFRNGYISDVVSFTLKHKPSNTESRYFTLTWTFDNGHSISANTQSVVW